MTTHTITSPFASGLHLGRSLLAWGTMLLSSSLPLILWQETLGTNPPLWLLLAQSGVLLGLLLLVRRHREFSQLEGLLRWLLAMSVGWHLLMGLVLDQPAWQQWQRSVPWVVRGFAFQALLLVPSVLLLAFGGARRTPQSLRLTWRSNDALAAPDLTTLWQRPRWSRFGWFWLIGISSGTLTAMFFAIPLEPGVLARLTALPLIMVIAGMNAFSEELQFRNVPLALLPEVLGKHQSLLLTGLYFGMAHFYGNPSGLSGVLLASFLGYVLGKSMVETNSSRWPWLIHWLQDVIIFSFLTMSWSQ